MLLHVEKIMTSHSDNLLVKFEALSLADQLIKLNLVAFQSHECKSLMYFVNAMLLLHDYFIGTHLAFKVIQHSKSILNFITTHSPDSDLSDQANELL